MANTTVPARDKFFDALDEAYDALITAIEATEARGDKVSKTLLAEARKAEKEASKLARSWVDSREYLPAQRHYLEEIDQAFSPLPVFQVPHQGKEVQGPASLSEIGRKLYDGRDPAEFFSTERPFRLTAQNGTYLLEIHLPFLGSEDVSVLQYGGELVVQVRGQRRSIFLPKFLGFYAAKDARLEEGWLRVRFEKAEAVEK